VVSDGVVRLRATLTGTDPYTRFEAAALRSKQAFRPDGNKRYYLTARVQLPDVLGIWPAFFIIPGLEPNGEAQWPPEVDIFEGAINGGQGENPFTLIQHAQVQGAQTASGESEWFFAAPGFDTSWGFWRSPVNLRNRWIEVGMEWTSDAVCYFIDGEKTGCERYAWVTNDGRLANPAEVVMLLAVGGPWAGRNGIDDGAFPTELLVDHIRVYERED
jgi:beta-glucanase (GH16 family)